MISIPYATAVKCSMRHPLAFSHPLAKYTQSHRLMARMEFAMYYIA